MPGSVRMASLAPRSSPEQERRPHLLDWIPAPPLIHTAPCLCLPRPHRRAARFSPNPVCPPNQRPSIKSSRHPTHPMHTSHCSNEARLSLSSAFVCSHSSSPPSQHHITHQYQHHRPAAQRDAASGGQGKRVPEPEPAGRFFDQAAATAHCCCCYPSTS